MLRSVLRNILRNKNMKEKIIKTSLLMCLIISLSGCSFGISDGIGWLDDNISSAINKTAEDGKQSVMDLIENGPKETNQIIEEDVEADYSSANNLTSEEKKQIDEWLEMKDFNRYGDDKSAVYIGGTPLFDEKTGESIDRYDYILNKFPDILLRIKGE